MIETPLLSALVYTDSRAVGEALRAIAHELTDHGWRLAGLVEHDLPRPGRSHCDMLLEELAGGVRLGISQDLGPHARGCSLDVGQLLNAMELVRIRLDERPDLMILNKFGKTESEGGGFRPLIADTLDAGVPLLIAVPWRNIESWRLFAGDLASEHVLEQIADAPGTWRQRLGFAAQPASMGWPEPTGAHQHS